MDAAQAGTQVGVMAAGPSSQAGREYPEAFIDAAEPSASSENLIYFLMPSHTPLCLSLPLSPRELGTGNREFGIGIWNRVVAMVTHLKLKSRAGREMSINAITPMPRAEEPFRDAASLFFGCRFICSALINSL